MSEARTYLGDETLAGLLRDCGSTMAPAAVRDLTAGVLAAPRGDAPDAWHVLVCAEPSPDLSRQLRALESELRCALDAATGSEMMSEARLAALRTELTRRGLGGFVVPRADEHQGEYVPLRSRRLAWLTGFTGSAGAAVVLADRAAVFVDGRYTLQVRDEVDGDLYEIRHLTEEPPTRWIQENLPAGGKLGYDPFLHTPDQVARLKRAAARAGGTLEPCNDNPVDAVWPHQPLPPIAPVVAHDVAYAGRSSAEKRRDVGETIAGEGAVAAVLTRPDSIAWLLNVRGGDVAHTPLPLSFAIAHAEGAVEWFIDPRKLEPGLRDALGNDVSISPPDRLGAGLEALGAAGRRVLADPASAAAWVFDRLEGSGATVVRGADPCALPKAKKNATELAGARAAHVRDGAALSRFLHWLDGAAAEGGVTEVQAAERLRALRRENERFCDLSFDTISGSGPNGAIVHYRVSAETDRVLQPGELYLVDSGAQYLDGTTDVTRTVPIGTPSAEMRDRFTRVLKGHIALATVRFPKGTTGSQLDALARLPLWQAGLDYDHGTGHGVGSYLGVHEGPQRISKAANSVALAPGMILSNEPGYYRTGRYGIRIENLVTVVALEAQPGDEREMYGFETLTLAPIDTRLVEPALLTEEELGWLDAYHRQVRDTIGPLLRGAASAWLEAATAPVSPQ